MTPDLILAPVCSSMQVHESNCVQQLDTLLPRDIVSNWQVTLILLSLTVWDLSCMQ